MHIKNLSDLIKKGLSTLEEDEQDKEYAMSISYGKEIVDLTKQRIKVLEARIEKTRKILKEIDKHHKEIMIWFR